ncbi:diguanylate cyclase (GGDEF) domain-containing protein [Ectothiorhodospira magna]|uniref:diguanylate cyclase n=1 Tax=Ectothiorhodospira magna TaxID=867345 RepID=A0A1H9AJ52_9GAMM|nr:diguanylate cyclase [Ectothiorhodospira magna]SEP76501.1 diguanylate cyclase (GGDEF) domain-containing protein [Ectothiorhodospira magna]
MTRNRLQTKVMGALLLVMLAMMVVVGLSSMVLIREFSVRSATEHTRTAAEMIRLSLTEAMVNNTIDRRDSMLRRLAQVNSLNEVRVIRGEWVIKQYGEGLPMESLADAIDRQVLASGEPYFGVVGGLFGEEFRATIPYMASTDEDINCIVCHRVPEGVALGAVTLTASVDQMKYTGMIMALFLVIIMGLFALLSIIFLGRLLRPLMETTQEISRAASLASSGDFSQRVRSHSNDEIGQIANHFNQMADAITHKLTDIRDHVARLVNTVPDPQANLLEETATTVSGLVRVSQFKQAIEEDQNTDEVFFRIRDILLTEFKVAHFSIYQVNREKRLINTVIVDGTPSAPLRWCCPEILEHSNVCRAVRTGHAIDGLENRHLCRAFDDEALSGGYHYLCLPIIQSGGVGSVIQLVVMPPQIPDLCRHRPLISAYLREAAPVLQAKSLMSSLRESSLKDAMTGLRNRRFLEEYSDSLVAQCKRRQVPMTLMMLDMDYFKTVNDTHGHDAGDQVLRDLAGLFHDYLRESDLVVRYGGEEFVIILMDTGAEAAVAVADKIREAVASHPFKVAGKELQKTISVGLASYPEDAQAFWQVLKYADVALYAAKERGRNQVVRFTSEMWPADGEY